MFSGRWLKSILIVGCLFLLGVSPVSAYRIDRFQSGIEVAKDTSLRIVEQIEVVFDTPRHGIIRTIPVIYRTGVKNVNSRVSDITVTDATGNKYQFSVSKSGNNLDIKIGDPDRTVTGPNTYLISYTARNILQRYSGYDELYWNVAGSDWDADIRQMSAVITSPFAPVIKSDCFGGCRVVKTGADTWQIVSDLPVPAGSDLTFVLGFDPESRLVFPDPGWVYWQDEGIWIALIFLPALIMAFAWWRRGRDEKFIGSNVYYQEAGSPTAKTGLFDREHLPLVYAPIRGLTPAEAGTILDMRVDLADVVAEISELARLGFITIHRVKINRSLLPDKSDYVFIRTIKPDPNRLRPHQEYLLDSLFKHTYQPALSVMQQIQPAGKSAASGSSASQLSKITGHFQSDLTAFREKLYSGLTASGFFGSRPDHLQGWGIAAAVILVLIFTPIANLFSLSQSVWPWGFLSGSIAVLFGYRMGYRTARGHALYRQLTGLKYFVGKGKWRYEIAEKHLFIEEILPLAISLGVVGQLSKDMQNLQMEPPKYLGNLSYVDFGHFRSGLGRTLAAAPAGTSSGWSGGSGFSGGSMGGGFGGGGGRSW